MICKGTDRIHGCRLHIPSGQLLPRHIRIFSDHRLTPGCFQSTTAISRITDPEHSPCNLSRYKHRIGKLIHRRHHLFINEPFIEAENCFNILFSGKKPAILTKHLLACGLLIICDQKQKHLFFRHANRINSILFHYLRRFKIIIPAFRKRNAIGIIYLFVVVNG